MKLKVKSIKILVASKFRLVTKYRVIIFIILVAAIYGYVLTQVNALSNAEPSQDKVTSELNVIRPPHIDKKAAEQLKALQDNSVTVKTLFEQARDNPFSD